eukprot:CAMPEP_0182520262 /NCGR_PEP_ID=MMETSP1321-20130603/45528_1 /TAXON_ID=91990 /ORGANISM="Bolidomonas sp., Strain RCC1657" /LENGTH=41 /DNA_ID= /DNA_START= /DNA_END= /DNA_ORIENTATION=
MAELQVRVVSHKSENATPKQEALVQLPRRGKGLVEAVVEHL